MNAFAAANKARLPTRMRRKSVIAVSLVVLTTLMLFYIIIGQAISGRQDTQDDLLRFADKPIKIARRKDPVVGKGPNTELLPLATTAESVRAVVAAAAAAAVDQPPEKPLVRPPPGPGPGRCSSFVGLGQAPPNVTVQMLNLYGQLPFDNPDGGVWKQGWPLKADADEWTGRRPLRVFVVPHSHNDPGWLNTFEEYFRSTTRAILGTMLDQMTDNPAQTFIWAEVSYFARWFDELAPAAKQRTADLVRSRRLEFVTGGWVMADEANSHWLSLVQQLTEGQLWLLRTFNVTVAAGWAIDPFGASATVPLLLRHAGIRNTLIQRTHYAVKKRLGQLRQLEFRWRQLWDGSGSTELFTHLMPFYSYDVPHTCGPDPKVCCQFDFKRTAPFGLRCPWNAAPKQITARNVDERAQLLLDQWRKKATLYRTNALLVPLGDDFRYTQASEWETQRTNYQRLFDHMNAEPRFRVQARFATLGEYFDAVHQARPLDAFPTLSGDFFTYADRDEDYWSGYYTSRPYHKRLDRMLMTYLRSAELLHGWLPPAADVGDDDGDGDQSFERTLRLARRALALFQHHDGITGTGREHVMRDYARRMDEALLDCKHVIQQALYRHLTDASIYKPDRDFVYLHMDDSRSAPGHDVLGSNRPTIILGAQLPEKYVVVHNALPVERDELVELLVSKPTVFVTDLQQKRIVAQVAPCVSWHRDTAAGTWTPAASATKFRLMFVATVAPLGARTFVVRSADLVNEARAAGTTFSELTLHNSAGLPMPTLHFGAEYPHGLKVVRDKAQPIELVVDGSETSVVLSPEGLLERMRSGSRVERTVRLSFVRYNARRGAYLFEPDAPAVRFAPGEPLSPVLVERGVLESRCVSGHAFGVHEAILRGGAASLELRNLIDMSGLDNTEVAMRIQTDDVRNGDVFYTDLNAMQSLRRQRFDKLPLQANYYPVPSYVYIEDADHRLTLLTAQPLGGTSPGNGVLEIMQDRRLSEDDERGLGQGVQDNRPVLNLFRLLFEQVHDCEPMHAQQTAGALTAVGHYEQQTLAHPMEKLVWHETAWPGVQAEFGRDRAAMDGDFEVAVARNVRNVPLSPAGRRSAKNREAAASASAMGLVVHRTRVRACPSDAPRSGKFNIRRVFDIGPDRAVHHSKITLLHRDAPLVGDEIDMCPMDIRAFIVSR